MNSWQYQLASAKQADKTIGATDEPKWIGDLSPAERHGAEIDRLLALLPTMIQVENKAARLSFFHQIVQECSRLAYIQTRAAQLSHRPTNDSITPFAQLIKQLAVWLRI